MSCTFLLRLGLTLLATQPLIGCLSTPAPATPEAPQSTLAVAAATPASAPTPAPTAAAILPLLLHLAGDAAPELPELSQRLQQALAGSPAADTVKVQNLRAISPGWYGLSLVCSRRSVCEQARHRLAAQTDWVAEIQNDGRRNRPTPVTAPTRSVR